LHRQHLSCGLRAWLLPVSTPSQLYRAAIRCPIADHRSYLNPLSLVYVTALWYYIGWVALVFELLASTLRNVGGGPLSVAAACATLGLWVTFIQKIEMGAIAVGLKSAEPPFKRGVYGLRILSARAIRDTYFNFDANDAHLILISSSGRWNACVPVGDRARFVLFSSLLCK